MFINNWYAACIASELADKPLRLRMLGCDFVLFRDSAGVAHCLSDLCVHRGASLALGSCRGDVIACPQHGWEFDGSGRCTLVPAGIRTPTDPPKRARVPSYPVQEKYGLLHVFLGDLPEAERPALPDIMPEADTGDWHYGVIARTKDVNYVRMAENYNDPCHVHYIHEFAKWLPKGVTILQKELTDTYVRAFHAAWDARGQFSENSGLLMEYHVVGCVSRNTNYQPDYPPQIVTAWVTPIDEGNTRIHMVLLAPKVPTTAPDGRAVRAATEKEHRMVVDMTRDIVMDEDYVVLKTTRPLQAASPAEELLVETDVTLAQVREMTRAWGAKMGEVDTAALAAVQGTHIRVVPCPGHRADPKNWVHRTVPLRPAGPAGQLQSAGQA
jgi:phenylpropionate dioxygenase-like ring-hydroxylating dioxygenase large terminal subunit